jgi:glycerol-3-phosphate dehydrogenase (NAD(P)+)
MAETAGVDIVVFAAGAASVRTVAAAYRSFYKPGQILLSVSKGLEPGTNLRLSEVIASVIPEARIAAFSGPCHAEELSKGLPSTYVASSNEPGVAEAVQDAFMSPEFRVYTNPDIIGVELGGALKNVIAIATGISDGLGNGDNIRAAIMTRGIVEIARLGLAMGARAETFGGLTGIGDLIATCTSAHSRNRRAGFYIGQGKSLEQALNEVHMLVEGVHTAKTALALARQLGVPMPITNEVNNVLFEGKDPGLTVQSLMERDRKSEYIEG